MRRTDWRDPALRIWWLVLVCVAMYIYYTARLGGFTAKDIIFTLYGLILFQSEWVNANVLALGVDLFLLGLGTVVWVAFFGQFVLPVRTVEERVQIVERLLSTLGRGQGPAILIQNGKIIDTTTEEDQGGAGVILLDSASAAVLSDRSSFTRAVGPGLVFTDPGETIFSPVDLRAQIRRIGPLDNDPDPDSPEAKEAKPEEQKAWQERRAQTLGQTRDGVEIAPQIQVVFRLHANPGEGNTRFGYREDSVWRAAAHQGVAPHSPAETDPRLVPWDWLPVQMAGNLWREYLRKFTFGQLFEAPPQSVENVEGLAEPFNRVTALETIIEQINVRMKQDLYEVYNEVGRPTGRKTSSRERAILLERGLNVLSVSVSNLRFSKDPVEKGLIERWPNDWLLRAQEEEKRVERRRVIQEELARQQAAEQFALRVSLRLHNQLRPSAENRIPEPSLHMALEFLIQGSLDGIRTSEILPQLVGAEAELNALHSWLRQARNGTGAPPEAGQSD